MQFAIYLRTYVRKLLSNAETILQPQPLQTLIDIFFACCISESIPFQAKKHCNLSLESLLMIYQTVEQQTENTLRLYEKIFENLAGLMQSGNVEVIKGCLLICQSVFVTLRSPQDLVYLFSKVSSVLTGLLEHFTLQFSNESMVVATLPPEELTANNATVRNLLSALDIILQWVNIHHDIFERYESKKYFGFSEFSKSQSYANIFKYILGLHVPAPTQSNQTILSVTGI